MPTSSEERNKARAKAWEAAWNNDPDRMVDECYAPDCVVRNMFSGHEIHGREALREVEHAIKAFDGSRHMKITNMVADGSVVAIQADVVFGGNTGKAVAFLTFDQNGLIVSDHSYGEDPSGASFSKSPSSLQNAEVAS